MAMNLEEKLRPLVAAAFADRALLGKADHRTAVEETVAALDRGGAAGGFTPRGGRGRVDDPRLGQGGDPALLRGPQDGAIEVGPFEFHDKIPLKHDLARSRRARRAAGRRPLRRLPRGGRHRDAGLREHRRAASARARWSTPGPPSGAARRSGATATSPAASASAASSSRPARARSSSRTACFIGSRAIVVEGVLVEREAVIGAGVVLTSSTAILDVTGPEVVEHRGRVPARSVVIPGTRPKTLPRRRVRRPLRAHHRQAHRRRPTARCRLNAALRDFAACPV